MTIKLNNKEHQIKLAGTVDDPYFCGNDVCLVLGYSAIKISIQKHVDNEDKKSLKELNDDVGSVALPTSMLGKYHEILSFNDGRAVYVSEAGLYSLIFACRHPNSKPVKAFMDQFFYDLRYKSGIMDIFTFMKDKKIGIDVNSPWFQELWYPISKKQHILETMLLLDWMGYAGEYFTQKQAFRKFLNNNKIPCFIMMLDFQIILQ
jgi:hypothetical protein